MGLVFANLVIDFAGLCIVALLLLNGRGCPQERLAQRLFNRMLLCLAIYLPVDAVSWFLEGRCSPGDVAWLEGIFSLIYFCQILLSFFWLLYVDYWLFRDAARLRRHWPLYALPLLLELVLLVVNLKTGWIFSVSAACFYQRGPYFLPSMLVFYSYDAAAMALAAWVFFTARERARKIDCLWLAGFMLLPIVSSFVLALGTGEVSVTAPFFTISLLMVYLNVHQKRQLEERQQLAQARVAVMLSQIQPHFLYNALSAIYSLCETDSAQAQKAVAMFSQYLRYNMDSLSQTQPIPFRAELEYVRAYAALEQMRFEEKLRLVWDIQAQGFMLPSLTVQPLVENAVKHGLCHNGQGGTITVTSREYADRYTVTIADDGCGFDPAAPLDASRSHIGIENVRRRLAAISHATLTVTSQIGVGTVAIITLPKEVNR